MSNIVSIRNLVILLFCIVFFVLFYYYNESLDALMTLEREKDKCQQGLDTISAQLQVVYEHKSRLEKSLQVEKENFLKIKKDQERTLGALQKKLEGYKKQLDLLRSEHEGLQQKYTDLKLEKDTIAVESERKLEDIRTLANNNGKNLSDAMRMVDHLREENTALLKRLTLTEQTFALSRVTSNNSGDDSTKNTAPGITGNGSLVDLPRSSSLKTKSEVPIDQIAGPVAAKSNDDSPDKAAESDNVLLPPNTGRLSNGLQLRAAAASNNINNSRYQSVMTNSADERDDVQVLGGDKTQLKRRVVAERRGDQQPVKNDDEAANVLPPPAFKDSKRQNVNGGDAGRDVVDDDLRPLEKPLVVGGNEIIAQPKHNLNEDDFNDQDKNEQQEDANADDDNNNN